MTRSILYARYINSISKGFIFPQEFSKNITQRVNYLHDKYCR